MFQRRVFRVHTGVLERFFLYLKRKRKKEPISHAPSTPPQRIQLNSLPCGSQRYSSVPYHVVGAKLSNIISVIHPLKHWDWTGKKGSKLLSYEYSCSLCNLYHNRTPRGLVWHFFFFFLSFFSPVWVVFPGQPRNLQEYAARHCSETGGGLGTQSVYSQDSPYTQMFHALHIYLKSILYVQYMPKC